MPNVCLIGFKKKRARELKKGIFTAFANEPFVKDMVVCTIPRSACQVEDIRGCFRPFIRLYSTQEEVSKILKELAATGEDVEYILLRKDIGFTPGGDVTIYSPKDKGKKRKKDKKRDKK